MEQVQIIEIREIKAAYLERVNELLSQLGPHIHPLTADGLSEIAASPGSRLFLLYYGAEIAGMLTVGSYRTPSGRKYWIEDVVVDDSFRGKGLGKALVEHAVCWAGTKDGGSLMLTSSPARAAANKLYQTAGFQQKHTNVYKMDL